MKAVVVQQYGGPEVASIQERPSPSITPHELLVRVEAVAVTSGDARIRGARFPRGFSVPGRLALGLRGPRNPVLGSAFSGVVEKVGASVEGFALGDEIAGMNGAKMGAHAQLAAISTRSIAHKPAAVSHLDAAGVLFGGTTALRFLDGRVRPGRKVLVNGASGAVGTSAVQLAALAGAEVTAVTSAANAKLVSRLGATHVVDYRSQPLTSLPPGFDLVFDAVGNIDRKLGLSLTGAEGVVILAVASLWDTARKNGRVVTGPIEESANDVAKLLSLVASRQLDPMTAPFGELDAIIDAYRLVDSGHKVGNVVVQPWT